MATLLSADLPSDEEDDIDYEAAKDKTAEAEDRRQFAGQGGAAGGSRKRPRRAPKFIQEVEEEQQGAEQLQGHDKDEEEDLLAADDESDPRVRAKKAKVGQLWDLLNSKPGTSQQKPNPAAPSISQPVVVGGAAAAGRPTKTANTSLAALCKPATPAKARNSHDELWMRSLGMLPKNTAPPKPKPTPSPSPAAPQASSPAQPAPPTTTDPPTGATAAAGTAGGRPEEASPAPEQQPRPSNSSNGAAEFKKVQSPIDNEARAAAAAALAAVRGGSRTHHDKVEITETRRFAGKDIQVTMQCDKNSKEAQKAAQRAAKPPPSSGLDAFLAEIEKKRKVNVLDKSKADWQQKKAGDATLEEELEAHRRSGGQYLDKQEFLKRAELREYEKERDKRLASDVRNRGRL